MSDTLPRIASFHAAGQDRYGLVTDDGIVDLHAEFAARFPTLQDVIAAGALEAVAQSGAGRTATWDTGSVRFLIPLARPGKIICVGVNFPDRNDEYKDGQAAPGRPSLFVRFPGSLVGHDQPVLRPAESEQLDYEGEIAIVIGKSGRRIAPEAAYVHIAALTLCNDGSIRDWMRHGKFNVTQGKNWQASGSMGPWLVPLRFAGQLDDIEFQTRVNGELRQHDRTGRMIYDFRYLVNYASTFTTLDPGDILVCGTPKGAGARFDPPKWLKPGDVVEVEAEGIGTLRNHVADER